VTETCICACVYDLNSSLSSVIHPSIPLSRIAKKTLKTLMFPIIIAKTNIDLQCLVSGLVMRIDLASPPSVRSD